MKVEWLVIAYHYEAVNIFSIQVHTARQALRMIFSGILQELFRLKFIAYLSYKFIRKLV